MYKVTDLINHYNQLVFFALRRYESDNYAKMREYFASIFIKDISEHIDINSNLKISIILFSKIIKIKLIL